LALVIVGANHKSAPLDLRESLALSPEEQGEALESLLSPPELAEALIISTCNRTEVLARGEDVHVCVDRVKSLMMRRSARKPEEIDQHIYVLLDEEAVRHLFCVASSMDSMVVGEPQILGQVKEAYRLAVEHGAAGPTLNRLLHHAFRVSKRVRTETDIGRGAVSVAYAAVEMARSIFRSLVNKTVLLVGAGEMIELAARHLKDRGVERILVSNRTFSRAQALAAELGGKALAFEALPSELASADMVLSCTGSQLPIIGPEQVRSALRTRKNRPMFFIDIAVPRDIDPRVGELDNVFLYDMDDLQRVVEDHRGARQEELKRAGAILEEETRRFAAWLHSLEAEPTIRALTQWAEQVRQAELSKSMQKLKHLGEREQEMLDAMTRAIVNKLLHRPITRIKQEGGKEGSAGYLELARELFGLNGEPR
jgi:glutamyl-tRNA reductase